MANLPAERLQENAEALTKLSQCRSVPDYVAVQSELVRENWHQAIEANRRIAEALAQRQRPRQHRGLASRRTELWAGAGRPEG
jgi:hypothetical protein